MLSTEVLKKIRMLHFKSRKMATDVFAGRYTSAFKGQGMEFTEVREYYPGDDPKTIDWNVSARLGHPFVKVFHEERELTVILLIDISASNKFGTRMRLKKELLGEVAGMLAFLAIRTNDKVGAIFFSSFIEKFIPPKKGVSHVWRLIKEIFTFNPKDTKTNISAALDFLNRVIKRHAIVFIISDFLDTNFEKALKLTSKKHEVTSIRIIDPAELFLPAVGLVTVQDPETGQRSLINTSQGLFRDGFKQMVALDEKKLKEIFLRAGIDTVKIYTNKSVIEPMIRLFEVKGRR